MAEIGCPHCGHMHPEGAQFCPLTGKPLEMEAPVARCLSCGEVIEPIWVVCAYCGKPLQQEQTCPNCGEAIEKSWVACAYCGQLLRDGVLSAAALNPISTPPTTQYRLTNELEYTPKKSTMVYWVAGLATILVMAFVLWIRDESSGFGGTTLLEQKPEHYGVYLKEGSRLVEIAEQEGSPGRKATSVPVHTNQSQPTLLVWNPGLDFQNLYLVSDGGEGQEVIYVTTPKDDGMLEIKPREPIQDGIFCLIQADPFGVSYFFPNWCFMVDR